MQRKFTKKEIIALSVLIILMIAVITAGTVLIVGNVNDANDKAADTQNTTVDITLNTTSPNDETNAEAAEKDKPDKKSSKSSKTSSLASKSETSEKTGKSSKTTSKSNKSTASKSEATSSRTTSKSSSKSSSGGNKINIVTPETNATHASKEVCTINGKKCFVGDEITLVLNLKTPKVLVNFQGHTSYDSDYLKFISSSSNAGGLVNNHESVIYYNASVLSGIDLTSTGTIYTAKFKVNKAGSTTIENVFEVITDLNDNKISESECVIGLEIFD